MKCLNCNEDNINTAKFCKGCGEKLSQIQHPSETHENEPLNPFGTIEVNKLYYCDGKKLFTGGTKREVPLKNVNSVLFIKARDVYAIYTLFLGVVIIISSISSAVWLSIIGLALAFYGAVKLWGVPTIILNMDGISGDDSSMRGWPWETESAQLFVKELRRRIKN